MIIGNVVVYTKRGEGDEEVCEPVLVEVYEWGREVEIAFMAGTRRVYLSFKLDELIREGLEQSQ